MDALNALGNGISPVNVSLEGYQLAGHCGLGHSVKMLA